MQLTLMAVERQDTRQHWEKAKHQVWTCFRYCTVQEQCLKKTHTGWENGAEGSGHAFIPKVCFPALPAQLSTPCYPNAIPRYCHLLKSSSWFPGTVEALSSRDCSSLTGKPLSSFPPNEAVFPPKTCISLGTLAASRNHPDRDEQPRTLLPPTSQGARHPTECPTVPARRDTFGTSPSTSRTRGSKSSVWSRSRELGPPVQPGQALCCLSSQPRHPQSTFPAPGSLLPAPESVSASKACSKSTLPISTCPASGSPKCPDTHCFPARHNFQGRGFLLFQRHRAQQGLEDSEVPSDPPKSKDSNLSHVCALPAESHPGAQPAAGLRRAWWLSEELPTDIFSQSWPILSSSKLDSDVDTGPQRQTNVTDWPCCTARDDVQCYPHAGRTQADLWRHKQSLQGCPNLNISYLNPVRFCKSLARAHRTPLPRLPGEQFCWQKGDRTHQTDSLPL